ncbi:hypothetical protein EHS25_009592 [Saitozyma podzolica]|uniref:Ubiquitin 3 binding protein But2 C-terminal domain-containing protein n=1 Tax=Saitozyma podzolica TaxID=1890683 RepID=A0A427YJP3_9TREE|nr:hypothetical protein EHS25_009592 [Saitozyma podzolica]
MLRLKHLTVLSALLAAAVARPADNPDNLIGVEGRGIPAKRDSGESATVAIQIDPYVSIVEMSSQTQYWPGDLTSITLNSANPRFDFTLNYYDACTLQGMPPGNSSRLELMPGTSYYGLTGASSGFGITCGQTELRRSYSDRVLSSERA